jgi:hypothetical protein
MFCNNRFASEVCLIMKIASLSGTHIHSGSALIIIPILFFFLDTLYYLIYILLT